MLQQTTKALHSLKDSVFGKTSNSTSEPANSNDAAAHPRPTVEHSHLPSQPARSPPSSEPLSRSSVASPTTAAETSNRRRKGTSGPSEDERRLTGDYRIPANHSKLPTLEELVRSQPAPPMTRPSKPGAASAFKPPNTLNEEPFGSGTKRNNKTYSTKKRTPSLIHSLTPGQQRFIEHQQEITPETRKRQGAFADGEASPTKRRRSFEDERLRENTPSAPIVLDDDTEQIQFVSSRSVRSGHGVSPSQKRPESSTSQRSATSDGQHISKVSQPMSEFQYVDATTNLRRKRSRDGKGVSLTPISNHTKSAGLSAFLSSRTGAEKSSPISLIDDDEAPTRKTPLPSMANQSVKSQRRPSLGDSDGVDELQKSSPFFPSRATSTSNRINLSTSEKKVQHMSRHGTRLRHNLTFKGNVDVPSEHISDGEDELQSGIPQITTRKPAVRRDKSPSRAVRPNRHSVQESRHFPEYGWLLNYLQTYDLEVHTPGLTLHYNDSNNAFDVVHTDMSGSDQTVCSIKLDNINQSHDDETSRIRVIGSQNAQGEKYWFDLEFLNQKEMLVFRDDYLAALPGHKNFPKPVDYMLNAFNKPYKRNDKVAMPAHQDKELELLAKRAQTRSQAPEQRPRRDLLVNKIDSSASNNPPEQGARAARVEARASNRSDISQFSTRPVRSTRSTRPIRDTDDELEIDASTHLSKYSVDHGLGTRWSKPLQYGVRPHRVLVDFDDLVRLDEGEFLNDNLVSFYMAYLYDQCKVPPGKVFRFNNFFYPSLTNGNKKGALIDYEAVRKWTKDVDIFTYDHIVVPICENLHWYLAIICNVSNINRTLIIDESDSSPSRELGPDEGMAPKSDEAKDGLANGTSDFHKPAVVPSTNDEEYTVFEDAQRMQSLATEEKVETPSKSDEEQPKQDESVGSETTRMKELSLEGPVPTRIMDNSSSPVSSKKTRRKSGPPQRKYDPQKPVIVILDSMGSSHPRAVKALKLYIQEEGKAKRGMDAIIHENTLNAKDNHIPQQNNFSDCGVYLLGYLQKFFQDPRDFVTRLLTREMDSTTDWPEMNASDMRNQMRDILLKKGAQQHEENKRAHQDKKKAQTTTSAPLNTVKTAGALKSQPQSATKPDDESTRATSAETSTKATNSPTCSARIHSTTVVPLPLLRQGTMSPKRAHSEIDSGGIDTEAPQDQQVRSQSPKRPRIDGTPPVSIKSPPRAIRSTRALRDSPQATRPKSANTQRQSPPRVRGSSADPIEIEDSQDTSQHKPHAGAPPLAVPVPMAPRHDERSRNGFAGDELLTQLTNAAGNHLRKTDPTAPESSPDNEDSDSTFEGLTDDERGAIIPETPEPVDKTAYGGS